jgi:hypothetical protein
MNERRKTFSSKSRSENDWLSDAGASRRRTADHARKFLSNAHRVLDILKNDVAGGMKIDPDVITQLEETIAKYEPSDDDIPDLSRQIHDLTTFGSRKKH